MATYVLLLTMTPEGREAMVKDGQNLLKAADATRVEGVQWLGLYGVLGRYDFVSILDAPDNQAAARFSLELGVRAGAHIETLPAVPIGLLDTQSRAPSRGAPEARPINN